MGDTVIRFMVAVAPDRKAVGVFTASPINPRRIAVCLEEVAKKIAGANVAPADFVALAEHGAESSTYVFGTAGVVRFDTPQSDSILAATQEAVVQELARGGFEAIIGQP